VQDWPLGPLLGQCCGGRVRLLVEHLDDAAWFDAPTLATLAEARVQRRPLGDAAPAPCPRAAPARPGTTYAEPDDGPRLPLLLFGAGHGARDCRAAGRPADVLAGMIRAPITMRPAW
jgi:xanthine dehydrogenase accessory factor